MYFFRYADAMLGTVLVIISSLLLSVIIPMSVMVPKSNTVLALAPDFWIKIIVWSTLALGVFILVQGWYRARHELSRDEMAEIEAEAMHAHDTGRAVLGAGTAVIGLFFYYFLIQWVGMIVASILAIIGFVLLCGERRLKIAVPLAVLLPVGLYYFFLKVAGIPMPLGIFS